MHVYARKHLANIKLLATVSLYTSYMWELQYITSGVTTMGDLGQGSI